MPRLKTHRRRPYLQVAIIAAPEPTTVIRVMKPDERPPLTFRKLLEILAAVAVLELGFFLFRMGAAWWNQ